MFISREGELDFAFALRDLLDAHRDPVAQPVAAPASPADSAVPVAFSS